MMRFHRCKVGHEPGWEDLAIQATPDGLFHPMEIDEKGKEFLVLELTEKTREIIANMTPEATLVILMPDSWTPGTPGFEAMNRITDEIKARPDALKRGE